jgi:hypothetical protein
MNKNMILGGLAGAAAVYALSSADRRNAIRSKASTFASRMNGMLHAPEIGPIEGQATSHISSYNRFRMPSMSSLATLAGTGLALYGGVKKRRLLGTVAGMVGSRLASRGMDRYRHVS